MEIPTLKKDYCSIDINNLTKEEVVVKTERGLDNKKANKSPTGLIILVIILFIVSIVLGYLIYVRSIQTVDLDTVQQPKETPVVKETILPTITPDISTPEGALEELESIEADDYTNDWEEIESGLDEL